ncbi:MAG: HD domain-containing protein [Patescibacteria group bacterium]
MGHSRYPTISTIQRWMRKIAIENGIPKQASNTNDHSKTVWKFARSIMKQARDNGQKINSTMLKTGCYIHDIGRMVTGSQGSKLLKPAIIHCYAGYEIMLKKGYPELARMCVSHAGGSGLDRATNKKNGFLPKNFFPQSAEEKILAYSDARCSYAKKTGPYIGTFKKAYGRFRKYPGAGKRLLTVQNSIKKMTGNSSL